MYYLNKNFAVGNFKIERGENKMAVLFKKTSW